MAGSSWYPSAISAPATNDPFPLGAASLTSSASIKVTDCFVHFDGPHNATVRGSAMTFALNYRAAQMIAGGITFQICKNCGTSFFGGGAGHGKIKKRAGARFCSDKCRWTHHNKVRQAIAGTPVQ